MSFHPPLPKPKSSVKKWTPKKSAPKTPAETTASVKKPCEYRNAVMQLGSVAAWLATGPVLSGGRKCVRSSADSGLTPGATGDG